MTESNPSSDPEVQKKIAATRKERGVDYSHLTGGNGKIAPAEQVLLDALGEPWVHSYAVSLGSNRGEGYPTAYKIDLAMPELMIGVECDGKSHNSPSGRMRDAKKDAKLQAMGWTILRFWNQEILNDTTECVSKILALVQRASTT
jgi:hypothetical protein